MSEYWNDGDVRTGSAAPLLTVRISSIPPFHPYPHPPAPPPLNPPVRYPSMSPPTSITLCMGSSCFSRGNGRNLPRIQQFLKRHGLDARLALKGCRCGSVCTQGPNIWIDGSLQPEMTGAALDALLESLILGRTHRFAPTLTGEYACSSTPTP